MNFDNLQSSIGPQGTAGPQGPQGEKGEKDDPGASALTRDLSIRPVIGNVAENGFEKSIASCDSDEILTGGGYEQSGPDDCTLLYSKPVGNSWEAKSFPLTNDFPSYTQAYAQCQ